MMVQIDDYLEKWNIVLILNQHFVKPPGAEIILSKHRDAKLGV